MTGNVFRKGTGHIRHGRDDKTNSRAPGINNLGACGRWTHVEFVNVYQIQHDFAKKVEAEFNKMIDAAASRTRKE